MRHGVHTAFQSTSRSENTECTTDDEYEKYDWSCVHHPYVNSMEYIKSPCRIYLCSTVGTIHHNFLPIHFRPFILTRRDIISCCHINDAQSKQNNVNMQHFKPSLPFLLSFILIRFRHYIFPFSYNIPE